MHHHLSTRAVLGWWNIEPAVTLSLLLWAVLYFRGVAEIWESAGRGKGIRYWEAGAFAGGIATLVLALLSPLDALSDILFSAHMTQHELLILVAAPLIVLGRPLVPFLWALPPAWRSPAAAWCRRPVASASWSFVTGPLVSLLVHAGTLWLWHLPVLFQAAMRHEWLHAFQHLTFFLTAGLFWWALIHGRYGRLGYGVGVVYVFLTAMHSGLLGAFFTFTNRLWYPIYAARGEAWSVNPLEDQRLAGLIMWVPAGMVFILVGLALFAAWLGESERRVLLSERERLMERAEEE